MSHARRTSLEKSIQHDIELALGAEPDLLLLRNSVGEAKYYGNDGKMFVVPYGLGDGSPDIVGLLRVELRHRAPGSPVVVKSIKRTSGRVDEEVYAQTTPIVVGVWFCLEIKTPESPDPEPHQERCHTIWRRFGAFIDTVHDVPGARAALERARRLEW